jgi:hypothetical protein
MVDPRWSEKPMDGGTLGLVGGVIGAIGGCIGAWLGARATYRAAVNEAQRQFYRRMFAWLVPIAVAFIAVVWLTATDVLPDWIYLVVMVAWFAPLGPAIMWANRRLTELAAPPDPSRPAV